MKLNQNMRKVHRWLAVVVAAPFLVTAGTGILLLVKKQVPWVQPPERKGGGKVPEISFERILEAARSAPEAGIAGWEHVDRLDVRPGKGMVKVQGVNRWEVQVDLATGEVLQTAYRRSDLIESFHDGSWFHPDAKLLVWLPAGLCVFVMWATGVWMFFYTRWRMHVVAARKAEA